MKATAASARPPPAGRWSAERQRNAANRLLTAGLANRFHRSKVMTGSIIILTMTVTCGILLMIRAGKFTLN